MKKTHCTTYYHLKYSKKKNIVNQGGTRCFAKNTLVKTYKGYKNIQDINTSDKVLSYNEAENKFEYKAVNQLYTYKVGTDLTKPLIKIKVNGEVIICTYDHEIYTITENGKQKGWIPAFIFAKRGMATSEWNKLKVLCKQFGKDIDYELQMHWSSENNATSLRWVRVLNANIDSFIDCYLSEKNVEACVVKNQTVYDLSVEDNHNYVITKSSLLVHNSGKTYSTLEFIIELLLKHPNKGYIVEIVRKERTQAMATVAKDFEEIMKNLGVFHRPNWRKLEASYTFDSKKGDYKNPNMVYFSGMDGDSARGRKRHILYVNEANQVDGSDFLQLQLRTMNKIIIDFNPSFITNGWIDELLEAKDSKGNLETDHFITTYKDNPFLTKPVIKTIEDLKETNPTAWTIFGTGQRAKREDAVFTNYTVCDELKFDNPIYGLDFGYNDPCSLIKTEYFDETKTIHAQQMLYKSRLSLEQLEGHIRRLVPSGALIVADSSSPDIIEHLNSRLSKDRIRIIAVSKSVNIIDQLSVINNFQTCIVGQDLEREFKMYSYMLDKDENPIDKIDAKKSVDHAIDAFRYAAYYQLASLARHNTGLSSMLNLLKKQKSNKINSNR